MVTRFAPGGYQPQHAGESTAEKVRRAVAGLGALMDDYEFHYPQELSPKNQWQFIDAVASRVDGAALHAAQQRKDAVAAYELVYAALGA